MARQRQKRKECFEFVHRELRTWQRGELACYVDGEVVPSLRPSALTVDLVHDWAFAQLEGGEVRARPCMR